MKGAAVWPWIISISLLCGCGNKSSVKPLIALVLPAVTNKFYLAVEDGAKEAADELGYEMRIAAPDSENGFEAQGQLVEGLISQGADAIAVCAIDSNSICASVKKANQADVPLFVFSSLLPLPDPRVHVHAYIGYNQEKAGILCGMEMLKRLRGRHGDAKGNVVILQGLPGTYTSERTRGFTKGLLLDRHPGIIVTEFPGRWIREEGETIIQRLLARGKTIDGVFGCSDAMAQGAAHAAIEAGVDLISIGIDGNPGTLDDIEDGVITASVATYPREIGRQIVIAIDRVLKGKDVERFIETTVKLVTRENIYGLFPERGG